MAEADVPRHFAPYHERRAKAEPLSPILRAWVAAAPANDLAWLAAFAQTSRSTLEAAAEAGERNPPRLVDGEVVLDAATTQTLASVHGGGLWHPDLDERVRYAAVMVLNQNGEGGVACSVACTDGLIHVLRQHPQGHHDALRRLDSMTATSWLHGAQFVTEIQGGSDAAANTVRAEPRGDGTFALHGLKWFCSNLTADLWLVTARPDGAPTGGKGVGLFLLER